MAQDLRDLADEDLMQLVRRGQAPAFEVVYERHASAAFSLAYRIVGTRNGAEDVTQEAFLNLWRSGARYDRARGSVRTWVLGHRPPPRDRLPAPRHRARQAARQRRGDGRALRGQRAHRRRGRPPRRGRRPFAARSDTLPAEQSQVIELAYFGGFTHTEIAEMLETPIGTIKGRMRLGLKKMRDQLAGGAVTPLMQTAGPDHERWEDAAAAYLLGALDDDERAGFEAHLAGCPACRAEVDELLRRRAGAADLRRSRRTARRAEGADHGRGRARGLAARRRRAPRPTGRAVADPRAAGGSACRRCTSPGSCRRRWPPRCWSSASAIGVGVDATRRRGRAHGVRAGHGRRPGARRRGRGRDQRRRRDDSSPTACRRRRAAASTRCGSSGRGTRAEPTSALFTPQPRRHGDRDASRATWTGVAQVLVTDEPDGGSRSRRATRCSSPTCPERR